VFPTLDKDSSSMGGESPSPISPSQEFDFQPPPSLLRFLHANRAPDRSCCLSDGSARSYLDRPPVFIGFGSMVIKNLESVVSLFLEAAALIQVRVVVQMGWTDLSSERFIHLAREAQRKADLIRQVVALDDDFWSPAAPCGTAVDPGQPRQSFDGSNASGHWLFDIFRGNSGASKTNTIVADREPSYSCRYGGEPVIGSKPPSAGPDAPAADYWIADRDAHFIGPCPHNWLFQRVSAVVHHGGAGTLQCIH